MKRIETETTCRVNIYAVINYLELLHIPFTLKRTSDKRLDIVLSNQCSETMKITNNPRCSKKSRAIYKIRTVIKPRNELKIPVTSGEEYIRDTDTLTDRIQSFLSRQFC